MVDFNLEVTHATDFALKTTSVSNEATKKENLASKSQETEGISNHLSQQHSLFVGKNGVLFAYFRFQSTNSENWSEN